MRPPPSHAGPEEYAPRSTFDPERQRAALAPLPDDQDADRLPWRPAPQERLGERLGDKLVDRLGEELGGDFLRFGSRLVPERRSFASGVFTVLGQVTVVLVIAGACGYLVLNFLARGPGAATTEAPAEAPRAAPQYAASQSASPPPFAAGQAAAPVGAAVAMSVPRAPARPDDGVTTANLTSPATSRVIRGVSDTEIRLGMAAPFTGPAKEMGRQLKMGIESAFDELNDGARVGGRLLKLVTADDGYEPARTAGALKQLYEKDQVFCLIGNYGSPTALVSVPFALEHRMVSFGAFTGANSLRQDPPDRYVFNYRAGYSEEADALVRYLVKVRGLQPEQIGVLAQKDAYGDAGTEGVAKAMRALRGGDGTATLHLSYNRNTVDVDEAIAQLRAYKAPIKAMVLVATYRPAAKFIEKTRDFFPGMIYATISGVGSTGLADELSLLGPRFAQGVIVTQVVPAVDGYASVVLGYRNALAKYFPGEAPDYISLEGYLASRVMIEGLKRAGPQVDTEKLVDTLENMRQFDLGLGTLVNFGPGEHQAVHKVWGTELDQAGHYHPIDLQ
jgi:ABC-type branched-subunit amino acid transport system substrate-binding protein